MTTPAATAARVPAAVATYLAVVQFFFVTTWTVYVIFLPKLLESAGLPAHYAGWILILDQLIFMAADIAVGVAADRTGRTLGRLGPLIVGLTLASTLAFVALPHAALSGGAAPAVTLSLVVVWAITSSALRAPPFVLLGRYAAAPQTPSLNAVMLTGLAIGGALAPYLGMTLKNIDPRIPFALAAGSLAATVIGLIWVERRLSHLPAPPPHPAQPATALVAGVSPFLAGCLLLAAGFQSHFALNSAGQYLRFAEPRSLEYLMPVFWIGFNVAMFPGAAAARRYGALHVMCVAALVGSAAALAAEHAPSLDVLIAAQLVVGGAWGCALMAAFSAAIEFGRTGREGLALGLLFSMLAAATLARIGVTVAGANKLPEVAAVLAWLPAVLWLAGGMALLWIVRMNPVRTHGAA